MLTNCEITKIVGGYSRKYIMEVNSPATREKVVRDIRHLLRVLMDSCETEAAFIPQTINVVCDEINNTPDVIDAHKLVLSVSVDYDGPGDSFYHLNVEIS